MVNLWWGWCAVLALSCASLLGLESRELDTENYPAEGYEGCTAGEDCSRCTSERHREQCDIPPNSICGDLEPLDACSACACNGCAERLAACQQNESCAAIWECVTRTRCDLLESSENDCSRNDTCRTEIRENGGTSGPALRAVEQLRNCAAEQLCSVCLPAAVLPPAECTQDAGCQNCGDCFSTCICSGDTFSTCKDECGETVTGCTQDNGCVGCSLCLTQCSCLGNSQGECLTQCNRTCRPSTECSDCEDCRSACECNNEWNPSLGQNCAEECASPPVEPELCRKETTEDGHCEGCEGCLARCTCQGDDLATCLTECGSPQCSDAEGGCTECTNGSCVCAPNEARTCLERDSVCEDPEQGCEACACTTCPAEFALCLETAKCPEAIECLRTNNCDDLASCSECRNNFANVEPAVTGTDNASPSLSDVIEVFRACTETNDCPGCF